MEKIFAPCEYLVGICLMPDIPDHLVERRIENIMDGNGKFDCAKACTKVAGILRKNIDDERTDLLA